MLAALLDGHGIPGTVLTAPAACQYLAGQDAGGPPDPQRAWSALLALQRAGLVAVDPASTPPAVWVSPAVQAAVRAAAPPDLLDQAARAAADALVQAWPADPPRSWLAAALRSCAVSLRQAAGDALWAGGGCPRLLLTAGHSLEAAGLAGPAVAWWRDLAAGSQRILGPDHPDTLVTGGLLAAALLAAGQAAEAVTWFGGCWPARASMLGPDHPATHRGPGQPGPRAGGRRAARRGAAPSLEQAAGAASGSAGPATPGRWPPGTNTPPRAWPRARPPRRSAVTSGHWPTASSLHGPGSSRHPGRPAAASRRLPGRGKDQGRHRPAQRVLADREQALGADHPDTLAARAGLAAACDAAGQMGAALQQHQEACAGYERVFGADHPAHPGPPRGPGPCLCRRRASPARR